MATQLVRRAISRVPALSPVATATLLRSHASEAQAQQKETAGKPASNAKTFQIYRWNPDSSQKPEVQNYEIDLKECGPMVLDALLKIKNEIDPTLTFRSCREGICGSCLMKIDGRLDHACLTQIPSGGPTKIMLLPHSATESVDVEPSNREFSTIEFYNDAAISESCRRQGLFLSSLRKMCDLCQELLYDQVGGMVTLLNADKEVDHRYLAEVALKFYNDTKLKNFKLVKVCKINSGLYCGLTFRAREDGREEFPLFRGVVCSLGEGKAMFCESKDDDKVTLLPFDDDYVSSERACESEDRPPFLCKNDSGDGSNPGMAAS